VADHQEEWQVYASNGESVSGESIVPTESRKTNRTIVGAAHVWIWRRVEGGVEVLLQLRAKNIPVWPNSLDISVAGHVDAGESILQAAVREGQEEVGITLDVDRLEYIFSYRNFENGIKWVYLYEEITPQTYEFNDGEVQSLDWVKLQQFEEMIDSPETHNLVPHPPEYFSLLVKAVRHLNEDH
jgi:isopentenyl-diphosphate delta-isomerase